MLGCKNGGILKASSWSNPCLAPHPIVAMCGPPVTTAPRTAMSGGVDRRVQQMSQTPIVRPLSWLNASIDLGILVCFVVVGWTLSPEHGAILGAVCYLLLSVLLRSTIARHHRKAISLCKRQDFELAIPQFEKSAAFFSRYKWVDRWRAITMLSVSGMTYREMALVSLGFCYGQLRDGEHSRQYYEQALREFPGNGMAQAAIRLLDAGKNSGNGT
jgi:hypothetical protein